MAETQVSPAKPTPRRRSTTVAPFKIGDMVTVNPNTDDAMFVSGRQGVVTDVEYDPADSWGPWIVRVHIPGVVVLAFQPSELTRVVS